MLYDNFGYVVFTRHLTGKTWSSIYMQVRMRLKGGLYFNFDVRVIKNFSFQDCQLGNIKAVHKGAV